jgi:biopolymer transport protein ExbD
MKYSGYVFLIAFASMFAFQPLVNAQTPALRQGVSVQMVETSNAAAFPAADGADAWIVAVTADGHLYFGVKLVTGDELVQEMKATPRNRAARLYIKADAHAPFDAVKQALHAAHEVLFETAVLLTDQPEHSTAAGTAFPQGLEVHLGLPSAPATVVQLHNSARPTPALKVNDQEVPWPALQSTLDQASQQQKQKLVVVEADDNLPFTQVVKVIDMSRSIGAKVAVSLTNL